MFYRRLVRVTTLLSSVAFSSLASAVTPVFINEIHYDNASTDTDEAIEIAGPAGTDLSGWSILLYNGADSSLYNTIVLNQVLSDAGDGYGFASVLISGIQNGAPDGIALVDADNNVVQFLSYEGTFTAADGVAAGMSSSDIGVAEDSSTPAGYSLQLAGTGQVAEDFEWRAPGPATLGAQNNDQVWGEGSGTPPDDGAGDDDDPIATEMRIHDVQGNTDISPVQGSLVTLDAIVSGDFQGADKLNGFFLQEEATDTDSDSATSEGIFVYAPDSLDVNVGDRVRVTGEVSEFNGLTELTAVTALEIVSSGHSISPAELNLPVMAVTDLEAWEGMLVSLSQTLYVTETYNLGQYGEVLLAADQRLPIPTLVAAPGADANAQSASNQLQRLLLDDASTQSNPDPIVYPAPGLSADNTLRGGDSVAGLTGILGYGFGEYRVYPTATPNFVAENARTLTPELGVAASLKVASFNVLNFFNGDGSGGGFPTSRGADSATEFERQRSKIVAAIVAMDADILGLIEIENDGYEANSAIADLVGAINAALGVDEYAYINPGVTVIGTDEIAVGFIYKAGRVAPAGAAAILDSANSPLDTDSGEPLFNDDKNRPALVQTFRELATAARVTVALNHLKSKGSACDELGDVDTGDGQGNCNLTRTRAASAEATWLATDPTQSGDSDLLIMGDLNAYALEDPIATLQAAGYRDLLAEHVALAERYSYVFSGEWGYLDHALASASLAEQVAGVTVWHINADEPRVLDYNEEYKSDAQIEAYYRADPYRASDHDPVLVGLNLEASVADLVSYADDLVAADKLQGVEPRADNTLRRFQQLLERTDAVATRPGNPAKIAGLVCRNLNQAALRSDAEATPPDWISGEGLASINAVIDLYLDSHCPAITQR